MLFGKRGALSICAEHIVCCCASNLVWDLLCVVCLCFVAPCLSFEIGIAKRASARALVCDHALRKGRSFIVGFTLTVVVVCQYYCVGSAVFVRFVSCCAVCLSR